MASQSRKKSKKRAVVKTLGWLAFAFIMVSMLVAYVANQVTISSKRAELQTLKEQLEQQKTDNQEMERILSGDPDQVTEWVARGSYDYVAPNESVYVDVTGK